VLREDRVGVHRVVDVDRRTNPSALYREAFPESHVHLVDTIAIQRPWLNQLDVLRGSYVEGAAKRGQRVRRGPAGGDLRSGPALNRGTHAQSIPRQRVGTVGFERR